jgi:hypothetical protein
MLYCVGRAAEPRHPVAPAKVFQLSQFPVEDKALYCSPNTLISGLSTAALNQRKQFVSTRQACGHRIAHVSAPWRKGMGTSIAKFFFDINLL